MHRNLFLETVGAGHLTATRRIAATFGGGPYAGRIEDSLKAVPWDTPQPSPIASAVTVTMRDGRVMSAEVADFKGTPENPLSPDELRDKVLLLTRDHGSKSMTAMFDQLRHLEEAPVVDWISV